VQDRCYSTSTFLRADAAASVGSGGDSKTPAPAGSSTTRIFFVQRLGAKSHAALPARGDMLVSFFVEEIQKKLPILRDIDADSITLQVASADGTLFRHAKDAEGNEQPVTLDSMDTIDEALNKAAGAAGRTIGDKDKLRIIVLLPADAPLAASADGEDAGAVQRRSVRSFALPLSLSLSLLLLTLRVAAIPSAATIVPAPAALRAQAKLLADMRTSLKHSSPLENLATLTLGSSGLTALSAGLTAAPVSLVQFRVPAISEDVLVGPKGACTGGGPPTPRDELVSVAARAFCVYVCSHPCCFPSQPITPCLSACLRLHDPPPALPPSHAGLDVFTSKGGFLLLEQGRLTLAQEFVKAMSDPCARAGIFGVLLSGPNGIGEVGSAEQLSFACAFTSCALAMLSPCFPSCCRQECCRHAQLPGVCRTAPACRVHAAGRGLGHGCQGRQGRCLLPAHAAEAERW